MDENQVRRLIQEELRNSLQKPLATPLHLDTIFALKNGGLLTFGKVTLSTGTATILDRRINSSSLALLTYFSTSSPGILTAVCDTGELTIDSSDASDNSEVQYLIIF